MRGAPCEHIRDLVRQGIIPAYAGSTTRAAFCSTTRRDHPRVCGEHAGDGISCDQAMGSSPRMRGARILGGPGASPVGIIPAYAGSTSDKVLMQMTGWDHPRVCGEHIPMERWFVVRMGSSPRMRGARKRPAQQQLAGGIIPAYAGSTRRARARRGPWRDHPRVCGEHTIAFSWNGEKLGSSPRMRGARVLAKRPRSSGRIIPAYAGSTSACVTRTRASRDHPRVCGEHPLRWHTPTSMQGSSPRMRGALTASSTARASCGIIPAYAGSTPRRPPSRCSWRDHPRVCGEHGDVYLCVGSDGGSSPRMRGAPVAIGEDNLVVGIIPAYAGSTFASRTRGWETWDHPRVCGEHSRVPAVDGHEPGSFPRMRGAPRRVDRVGFEQGIIPAYAGSTSRPRPSTDTTRDHPRVCGEHYRAIVDEIEVVGSSPRMRGALVLPRRAGSSCGIIPAYAGSTALAAQAKR